MHHLGVNSFINLMIRILIIIIFFIFSQAKAETISFSCPITYKSLNKINKIDKKRFYKKIINFEVNTSVSRVNYLIDDKDLAVITGVQDSIKYENINKFNDTELVKKRYRNIIMHESKLKAYRFGGLDYVNYTYKSYIYWGGTKKKGLVVMITDPDEYIKSYRDGTWLKKGVKNIFKPKGEKFFGSFVLIIDCE